MPLKQFIKNFLLEDPKVGLVLGGGGAKGLAHIGVIKAFEENDIPISFIAGTSIGALIGGIYAAHPNVQRLEDIANQNNWQKSFEMIDFDWKTGVLKGDKIEKLIEKWLDGSSFKDLKIPLTVVSTDLLSGKEVTFDKGDLVKAIRASISVPIVFKPVKYRDYLLSDGGLSNPLPNNIAREMGANIIVSVNLDNDNFGKLSTRNMSIQNVSMRSLNIMKHHLSKRCIEDDDIIIEPNVDEIGLIGWDKFFSKKETEKMIKQGETAANKYIEEIKKRLRV